MRRATSNGLSPFLHSANAAARCSDAPGPHARCTSAFAECSSQERLSLPQSPGFSLHRRTAMGNTCPGTAFALRPPRSKGRQERLPSLPTWQWRRPLLRPPPLFCAAPPPTTAGALPLAPNQIAHSLLHMRLVCRARYTLRAQDAPRGHEIQAQPARIDIHSRAHERNSLRLVLARPLLYIPPEVKDARKDYPLSPLGNGDGHS